MPEDEFLDDRKCVNMMLVQIRALPMHAYCMHSIADPVNDQIYF
jgi:hypothetical protein